MSGSSLRPQLRAAGLLVLLAALVATLAAYRPVLSPVGLHPRTSVEFGAAKARVLVYTSALDSEPTGIGQETVADANLAAQLALNYSLYLQSDQSTAALGDALGLKGQSVAASGPFTLLLGRGNFGRERPVFASPKTINHSYRLLLDVDGVNPTLTLYAQAPSAGKAIALVNAARTLLARHVADQESSGAVADGQDAIVRSLGPTTGALVDRGARWQLMVFVFGLVLLVGGSLIYADRVRRLRPRRDRLAAGELDRLDDERFAGDDWPYTTRLLPWVLAIFIAMLFLVPFQSINLPGGANLDRPLLIAFALLWISSLALMSGAARPRIKLTRIHVAVIVFFGLCCIGVAVNAGALANMDEVSLVAKKLALLLSYILFFVIAVSVVRPREVPRYVLYMVGLGVILALATVVEYRTHYNVFYTLWSKVLPVSRPAELDEFDSIGRLNVYGPGTSPLELAALLVMVLPFALMGSIDAPTRRRRIFYAVAVGLLLAGALATSRKTSLVAPVAAILLLMVYRPRTIVRSLLGLGLVLGVLVHFTSPGALGSVIAQLEPGHFNHVLTTTDREARYDAVRPDVMSHLLLGRGYESYDSHKYRVLDNEYLGILIGTGLVGFLSYLSIFGSMMSFAHRTIRGPDPRRASLALAGFASVGVIVVASALFDVFSFPHVPYLLLFVGALIAVLREPSPTAAGAPAAVGGREREELSSASDAWAEPGEQDSEPFLGLGRPTYAPQPVA
jgi:hypothetical protein